MEDYKVDKWSTICMKNIHYSVPDTLVGEKTVSVKIYSEKVVIFHGQVKVAAHERVYGVADWKIQLEHYARTLLRKPGRYKDRWHSCRCPLRYRNSSRYISG